MLRVPNIGIRGRPSHSALCNLSSVFRPPHSVLRAYRPICHMIQEFGYNLSDIFILEHKKYQLPKIKIPLLEVGVYTL